MALHMCDERWYRDGQWRLRLQTRLGALVGPPPSAPEAVDCVVSQTDLIVALAHARRMGLSAQVRTGEPLLAGRFPGGFAKSGWLEIGGTGGQLAGVLSELDSRRGYPERHPPGEVLERHARRLHLSAPDRYPAPISTPMAAIALRERGLADSGGAVVADLAIPGPWIEPALGVLRATGADLSWDRQRGARGRLGELVVTVLATHGITGHVAGEDVRVTAVVPGTLAALVLDALAGASCVTTDSWVQAEPGSQNWFERTELGWLERAPDGTVVGHGLSGWAQQPPPAPDPAPGLEPG